ncbi:MAG: HAMP domain-containing protein [Spirochaetes bacterium]|nr:HAMP domain-containing protein [Spirochaetota bacterium]
MKKQKGRRFTIGFKMILMISLILALSLTGLTYITTYFFEGDSVVRIQEVTSDKSQVVGMKVKTDLNSLINRANYIALSSFGSHLPGGSDEETLSPAGSMGLYRRHLLDNEESIFYIALVKKRDAGVSVIKDYRNDALIERIELGVFNFRDIVLSENKRFEPAFNGVASIYNSSLPFEYPVLALSFPVVFEKEDSSSQILVVYFSMNVFLEAVQSYNEYMTYIVNGNGELIAHPDNSLLVSSIDYSSNEIVKELLTGSLNNGQITYNDEKGVDQIGSFYRTDFAGVGIISTVDRETALEAVRILKKRNIYITIILLMITMMVVYIFSKTLTNPIKRLVESSRKISSGIYRLKIKPASNDEIGDLTESFVEMGKGLEEREKMKEAFGKFVNKEIAELAMKGELKLGGERKSAAIFFSDIRSFTAISEELEPEEVVEFLNEYMTEMVNCVSKTHGVVDKFIGDAVMAVWGTPVSHGNDTENAIDGALMMRQALIKFNKKRGGPKKPIIRIGCGINTGPVIAGQIGSHDRMEYTVIGDAVNLASRVEGLNKAFGTDILISDNSYQLVKDIFKVEAMRKITVKGKRKPQQIYAVLGRKDDPKTPKTVKALQKTLGIKRVDISKVDVNKKEEKYEIKKK